MIKTISHDQEEIITSILKLHSDNGCIDLDPTYSKGVFYKGSVKEPRYCFDINPKFPHVGQACATKLPLPDEHVDTIMFDPPFLATQGPSLRKNTSGNIINTRFGVFPNEKLLHEFYVYALMEFNRVLRNNGILIFKCQDKVSSGKQYFSHCFVHNKAVENGFYPKDLFVLLAKHRIVADWQKKNQKHARKYHSYFWVFQKKGRKINYV